MIRKRVDNISNKLVFIVRHFIGALVHLLGKRLSNVVPNSQIEWVMFDVWTDLFCHIKVRFSELLNLV